MHWYARVLALEPTNADTYCDLGTANLELGDLPTAMAEYERAIALAPAMALARANHVYLATKLCDWADYEGRHAKLRALGADLSSHASALGATRAHARMHGACARRT